MMHNVSPNIPPEYSQIKFQALNRHSVYDATEMDLSITCFLRVERYLSNRGVSWIESDNEKVLKKRRLNKYVLPKKFYTWQGFKDALKALGEEISGTYISYNNNNNNRNVYFLRIKLIDNSSIKLAYKLIKLFYIYRR